MQGISKLFFILFLLGLIQACSGDSFSGSSTAVVTSGGVAAGCTDVPPPAGCIVTSDQLSLSLSEQQIKSDGQDSTTITASVLDTNRAAIKDVQVTFSADAGKLSSSVAFTDENGNATVTFTSGTADPSNQIATVTATVVNVPPEAIRIEVIGTTLEIEVTNTSLQIPSGQTQIQETIKVTAKDAGGQRIYNVPIAFIVTPSLVGTATASLSSPQINTDTRGEVSVTLTAMGSGDVTFTAQGLGTTAVQLFQVANIVADNPFRITAPTVDPWQIVADGGAQSTVSIDVAAQNVTTVRFSTSIGQWTTGVPLGSNAVVDVATVAGVASATLQANAGDHGFATIVVSDAAVSTVFDSITVAMSPPVVNAAGIFIQSDVNVLAPSTGTTTYQANIEARVVTDDASGNFPIFNVPVLFEVANLPGGGETLTNSFGLTDLNGVVRTTFQSGTLPSGQNAVSITATVVNAPITIADTVNVVIGGTGGSVALGRSPFIETELENTAIYRLDMGAEVADSNGNAVAGSSVTLSMWPGSYNSGAWYDSDPDPDKELCQAYVSGSAINEDRDEDLILDQELLPVFVVNEDTNLDGELTPHNSTSGTAPSTVTTDAEGVGAFQLTYLKQYARWINIRTRGHTKVQGTETTGTLSFVLPALESEAEPCFLPDSPFALTLMGSLGNSAGLVTNPLPASAVGMAFYNFPSFEGNGNLVASVIGVGSISYVSVVIDPLAVPPTTVNFARYQLPAAGFNVGDVITVTITLSADPFACALANCTRLGVSFPIRVVVIAP